MNELTIDGQTYISSKRAAEITGYAKDYVGQLCREGRIEARLVGRNWYVLEKSVREHRFGKEEEAVVAEEVAEPVNEDKFAETPAVEWGGSRYKAEEPDLIPILNDRIAAVDVDVAPQHVPKSSVVTDMQTAWLEWFSKKEQNAPRAEIEIEELVQITEVAEDDEPVSAQEAIGEEEQEEVEEESQEVPITLHMAPHEPQEVLDLSKAKLADESDEVEVSDDYIVEEIEEEPVPVVKATSREGSYILVRSLLIAVMLVVVAITAIGTGYISKYDNYGLSRLSEIRFLAGVSEYNKQ